MGFIVALTDDIMTMPNLPEISASERTGTDEYGVISGLFRTGPTSADLQGEFL